MKYNIRKGSFSASGIHLGIHFGRVGQTYRVRFDSSCLYEDINWERDYNKLMGWSYSNLPFYYETEKKWQSPHHRNSVRLGWRANKEQQKVELAIYYYQDGIRKVVDWISVPVDTDIILGLFVKDARLTATFCIPEIEYVESITIDLPHSFKAIWSYKLYPYFGGSEPSPQDMWLSVEET